MLERFAPELSLPENEDLLSRLDRLTLSGRLPHAIIIESESGGTAVSAAMAIARGFLCECGEPLEGSCRACRLLNEGAHPDLAPVTGSYAGGVFSVDDIRRIRSDAALVPVEAKGKVYLLRDCDGMRVEAQNALLKVFEEPPEGVMFILTCRSASGLLETIRSRASVMRVASRSREGDEIPDGLRELAEKFACALCEQGDGRALAVLSYFVRDKKEQQTARLELKQMIFVLREIIRQALLIVTGASPAEKCGDGARRLAASVPRGKLFGMLGELDSIERSLELNASLGLLTAAMAVKLKK